MRFPACKMQASRRGCLKKIWRAWVIGGSIGVGGASDDVLIPLK